MRIIYLWLLLATAAFGQITLARFDQKALVKELVAVGMTGKAGNLFPAHATKPCGTYFVAGPPVDSHGPFLAYLIEREDKKKIVAMTERDQFLVAIDDELRAPTMAMKVTGDGIDGITILLRINSKDYAANQKCLPPVPTKL